MLGWIWKNKEWLFSGIGLFLIIAIVNLIIKARRKKHSSLPEPSAETRLRPKLTTPISETTQHDQIKPLATLLLTEPRKILQEIESQPFLLRPNLRNQYKGLKILWKGKLANARKIENGLVQLFIHIYSKDPPSSVGFFCKVGPNKYKGISLLKEGHEITVEGEVESVQEYYFYVKAENLFCKISST